ncbi:MAG: FHA domain-containing protein [Opitutae bacterium]|nr:FHA domain-containing protein [Opitutae bacterium]
MDAPPSQAWLELADGRMHWLDKNTCTIGRGSTCSLVLDLPGISRSHAMLQPGPGGGYLLADLRSTNGTYHNGLRLEQVAPLRDGDRLELGDITLIYRCQQAPGQAAESGATSVLIHSGTCWLLLLDLIGHTAHTQKVGAEAATADFKRWLELVRPVLLRSGGTINAYLGDAIFAYWRQDRPPADRVAAALRALVRLQPASPRPFRIVLHHARISISGGLQGESLTGSDVIFLFRIEKSTKGLGSACILSEAATSSLQLGPAVRPLGRHPVRDYPGEHAFFTLAAD